MNRKLMWNEYYSSCKRLNCSSASVSDLYYFSPIISSHNIKCYMRNKPEWPENLRFYDYMQKYLHTCRHPSVCAYICTCIPLQGKESIRTQTLWLLPASLEYFKRYLQLLGIKNTQQWTSKVPASELLLLSVYDMLCCTGLPTQTSNQ